MCIVICACARICAGCVQSGSNKCVLAETGFLYSLFSFALAKNSNPELLYILCTSFSTGWAQQKAHQPPLYSHAVDPFVNIF